MVGHQAVRPDFNLLGPAKLGHQIHVTLVVFVTEERLLPSVSSLNDVVGQARSNDTPIEP